MVMDLMVLVVDLMVLAMNLMDLVVDLMVLAMNLMVLFNIYLQEGGGF